MRWAILACLALLLLVRDLRAESRVALVVPDEPSDVAVRAEERLRAELMAAGYEVVTVSIDGAADRARLRIIAKQTNATAAVTVRLRADAFEGAVWAKDAHSGRESIERVRPANATLEGAANFAIWAAEQLRASLLAFEPGEPGQPPSESVRVDAPVKPPPPRPVTQRLAEGAGEPNAPAPKPARPYALSGGVAALFGPGGVPVGFGPSLSLSWHNHLWFGSVRFIGPVVSSLQTPSGTVDVDQEQALLRAGAEFPLPQPGFAPFVAAGLGAYRLGARGDAVAPYRSTSNQAWSGLVQLTGGLRIQLSDAFVLTGEAGAWLAGTRPVIRIEGSDSVHIGRPGYMGALELGLVW